ncbi:MAG: hypothetical protein H6737_21675 [Alphaproteobacteria bacterium]|nr:hypothetical protein [Alphaproteobacteria bacterium]
MSDLKPAHVMLPVVMLVVPLLLLGGYVFLSDRAKSEVHGTIRVGDTTFAPDRCASGVLSEDAPRSQPQFHGVDLFARAHPSRRLRVFQDPAQGDVVALRDGDAAPVVVDRAACERFEVRITALDEMLFDHWGLGGSVDLACPEVEAKVAFSRCFGGD